MKKIILLINLISLCFYCIGQNNKIGISLSAGVPINDPKYFEEYSGVGETFHKMQRNSYFSGLMASYNYNDTLTFRVNTEITAIDLLFDHDIIPPQPSTWQYITLEKYHQKNILFAPGFTWKFTNKKIQIYGGAEIPFSFLGKTAETSKGTEIDLATGDTVSTDKSNYILPTGFSCGIGGIFGVSIFPFRKFSVDAEFCPSLLYTRISGKVKWDTQDSYLPGNLDVHTESDYKYQGFFFDQRFSISLTYWFGCKRKNKADDK